MDTTGVNGLNVFAGKVDVKQLVSGRSPELYLTNVPGDLPPLSAANGPLTFLREMLQSAALQLAGVSAWPDHQRILEVGADSFNVVSISNQIEQELERAVGHPLPAMAELVEQLLTKPLRDVIAYLVDQVHLSAREGGCVETQAQGSSRKRERGDGDTNGSHDGEVKKKPCSFSDRDDTLKFTAWRRGQRFINGR